MGVSAFGWANAVKTAVLAATSAEVSLPVSNLSNDQGAAATGWQTLPGDLSAVVLTVTPSARTTFRMFGLFRTNLSVGASVSVQAYTNPGPTLLGTFVATVANGQAIALAGSDTPADFVTFTITDAANPDNHLNIPLAYAGPAWFPLTGMSFATTMGRDDITDTVVTRGGQTYVSMRATSRRWEIAMDGVRGSEVFAQLDVLDRASRTGANVLVSPDTTSANVASEATFGILKATADIGWNLGSADRRSWRARVTERL